MDQSMLALFTFFNDPLFASIMASVVTFVSFFLIARLVRARLGVAFAFDFAPLLLFLAIEATVAGLS
jgi:hypothetical protein